ncbi:MAG: T9SS type A sorting domain-containing protein [Bacteroidia bacterium]
MLKNVCLGCFIALSSFSFHASQAQSLNLNWENRYNGQGDSTSRYTCSAMASDGNIVLGGYTTISTNKRDMLVSKVTPQGILVWSYVYNGIGDGDDEAADITTDGSGNIYVAATIDNDTLGDDIVAFKFDTNGNPLWATFHAPTMNQNDDAVAIALDASGNIFIAGTSDGNVSPTADNLDFVTIKYSNAGAELWNKRMNGLANADDEATKLTLDAAGNVITVGLSDNGNDDDYVSIKYDTNGTLLWKRVIDNGDNDRPTDVKTDANNNVYVTGRSTFSDYDYYTIKYNSAGVVVWDNTFDDGGDDRATHLFVNSAGEVFVVGRSFNAVQDDNVVVQKINATGITAWTTTPYNGTANKADQPFGMRLDANGNIYIGINSVKNVVGTTNIKVINLVKYTSTGALSWQQSYNPTTNSNEGSTLTWHEAGNAIYWGGYTESSNAQRSAIVRSLDNAGIFKAQQLFSSDGEYSDNVRSIVKDNNGNIYWAGYSTVKGMYRNFTVGKISPAGATLWVKTLDGTSSSDDEAVGLAIDPSGNILAGGTVKNPNSSTSNDYFIAKFNPTTGDTLFTRKYNFTTNRSDRATAFASDPNGNFYLTGRTNNSTNLIDNWDWLTVKWNNNGLFQWAKTYSSVGTEKDEPNDIQVSNTGEVYVGGSINNSPGYENITALFLIKYDALGTQAWTKTYTTVVEGKEEITDLYWNANNNHIYYTGTVLTATNSEDVITGELDASGTSIWETVEPNFGIDFGNRLAVDKLNNVYISATTLANSATYQSDVMMIKYDNAGTQLWKKMYDSNSLADDVADDMMIDANLNMYVTGHSEIVNDGTTDLFVLVYDGNGNQKVVKTYNGSADGEDNPSTILLNSGTNEVYVGGGSFGAGNAQRDGIVLKYTYDPTIDITSPIAAVQHLVYPNPMQEKVVIEIANTNEYQIQWVDVIGKQADVPFTTTNNAFIFNTSSLSEGIYFYQIINEGKYVGMGKVIK